MYATVKEYFRSKCFCFSERMMLRSVQSLLGFKLLARDGVIGTVYEFYFDDKTWTVRYLVADTGTWLQGRRILIPPIVFGKLDWNNQNFPVSLTKEQIQKSPSIDEKKPVSREKQIELHRYFGWPAYWQSGDFMHTAPIPPPPDPRIIKKGQEKKNSHTHLRSTREVRKYRVRSTNGEIGHVEDYILNDESWIILYVVVDTGNWLPGKQVLVSNSWVNRIDWEERVVSVDLTKDVVKKSPEYDPSKPVNREYEIRLYDFYGRPKYWQ